MQKKTIEEIYQKKDLHQHILDRPDTYIGSNKIVCEEQYIFDNKIVKSVVEYNPGIIKIFDEILVNAIDHTVRDDTATFIKVNITEDGIITVMNNGQGIPIVKHKEHKVYIPEMIFGQLLTSSNYNDSDNRVVGGRNGLGSKLTCVYSEFFSIETIDNERELYYYQEFKNNMFEKSDAIVKKNKKKSYTKITFKPDYKRFKMKGLSKDTISLMIKRVYDCTACTNKNVNVYYNDEKLKQKDFQQYISLYTKEKFVYEKYEKDNFIWEYAAYVNESHEQISFVNGIATTQGGRHVEYILNQIIKKLSEMINSKKKVDNIKSSYIKDKLSIFVRSTIINPNFSSQTKELLTTPVKDFGCKPEVSDQFITKLYKNSGIVEEIISFAKYKNQRELQKTTDTVKRKTRMHIVNLEDAHNAGSVKSKNCTLILTEGLSAKTFAMSGLSVIGRDNYGVFPLKGKLLNVREATQKQLLENEEINNLKQIIGLQHNKKYTSVESLRYGSVCLLTDQDFDGSHIKGLLINMFHTWWPELLEIPNFLISMKTPIVKISKGSSEIPFYTLKDYSNWEKSVNNPKLWNIKYYKGLGTSTAKEAKDIFKGMKDNIIRYISSEKTETDRCIILAFEKKQADARKEWLQNYNFDMTLDQAEKDVTYSELINKELIHFSMYDVMRSIPSICDGLKPSQRKVLYTMFKKKYTKEIKVAQLGAAVAETTSYHHGEASLQGTIINMAQDYIGSNNINLLKPNGQFGSRILNGKDSASPRYIFTELNDITKQIYNNYDLNIVKYQEDDGQIIEPNYYIPILPMVLVNGAQGIGTGYSTHIPCYNPKDIINNMKLILEGKKINEMKPWYKGFTGTVKRQDDGNYIINGKYEIDNNKTLKITEIPIGIGIDEYKEFLEKIITDNKYNIINYKNNSTEIKPEFNIIFNNKEALDRFIDLDVYKILKLTRNISTKNFHLINENGTITKYKDADEIFKSFMKIRLNYNDKRKQYLIDSYSNEMTILENKIRFLKEIMTNELLIYKKSKMEIDKLLEEHKYNKIDASYNYLISLPIYSFTKEKLEELYKKYDNIKVKYDNIKNKNRNQMLLDDLTELIY